MERAIADFWSFGAQEANASQTQRGQLVKDQETLHGAIPNRTESIHKLFISAHACYPGNFRCSTESEGPLKVPCQTLKPSTIWSQASEALADRHIPIQPIPSPNSAFGMMNRAKTVKSNALKPMMGKITSCRAQWLAASTVEHRLISKIPGPPKRPRETEGCSLGMISNCNLSAPSMIPSGNLT